jgi:hypothetical protein
VEIAATVAPNEGVGGNGPEGVGSSGGVGGGVGKVMVETAVGRAICPPFPQAVSQNKANRYNPPKQKRCPLIQTLTK